MVFRAQGSEIVARVTYSEIVELCAPDCPAIGSELHHSHARPLTTMFDAH